MSAKLVILAGPRCGETFIVDADSTTIGRDASSQLNIPDHLMSRRHCALEGVGTSFTLRDLGSSNGTYVNGIPVRERVLAHGDRIRAGDSVLLFLEQPEQAAAVDGAAPMFDDRTARIRRSVEEAAFPTSDSQGAIVSEVLAGRVALQAHDMIGDSAPMR